MHKHPKTLSPRLRILSLTAAAVIGISAPSLLSAAEESPTPATQTDAAKEARIGWWRDARFGIFVHYGLYAIPGHGEWAEWNDPIPPTEYAKLADRFTAEHFDADELAQLAKDTGAGYIVLTSRHHDGFCLFDDKGNDFTTVNSAAKRDLVTEYVKAVRKAGLHVGLYYSPLDWRYPGYFMPDFYTDSSEAMKEQYHRQMDELMNHYGPIDIFWFDGGEQDWLSFGGDWIGVDHVRRPAGEHFKGKFSWGHDKVYAELCKLQPQALLNTRADMPEDFRDREGDKAMGDFDNQHNWELCTTIAGAWGYQPDAVTKSLKTCLGFLIGAAGRDGNLLLNVGPMPDGRIDPEQAARLREMGAWLKKYGESIYRTSGGPYLPGDWGVSTQNGNVVYLHIQNWKSDELLLPQLPAKVLSSKVLTGGAATVSQDGDGLHVTVPAENHDDIDTIVKLELEHPVADIIATAEPTN